jgi:hypothetical protein
VNAANVDAGPVTTYTYSPSGTPTQSGTANTFWPFLYRGGEQEFIDAPYYYSGGGQFYSPQIVRTLSGMDQSPASGPRLITPGPGGGGRFAHGPTETFEGPNEIYLNPCFPLASSAYGFAAGEGAKSLGEALAEMSEHPEQGEAAGLALEGLVEPLVDLTTGALCGEFNEPQSTPGKAPVTDPRRPPGKPMARPSRGSVSGFNPTNVRNIERSAVSVGGGAAAGALAGLVIGTPEGGPIGALAGAAIGAAIGAIASFFEVLFGGSSSEQATPRQLLHGRHPLYPIMLGISSGLIPTESAATTLTK